MSKEVSPFGFGQVASGQSFVNRERELDKLALNFRSNLHTVLLSPRRWGKTSLVMRAAQQFEREHSRHRVCHIDLYNVYSEDEFYRLLSKALLKATSTKMEGWIKNATSFLGKLKPVIKVGDSMQEFELGFDVELKEDDYQEILDLPERIAKDQGLKIVIALDEFQNCTRFNNALLFQQRLRAHWQHHKHVSYCLYGSHRSMLMELFEKQSMPFFKFGEVIYLQKIAPEHWERYVPARFKKTGKTISVELVRKLLDTANNHPYYVQYMSHLLWTKVPGGSEATEEQLTDAMTELFQHQRPLYLHLMDGLSPKQVNFLRALMKGEEELSSQKVLRKYELGSSANVVKIKEALERKEIIDTAMGELMLVDPLFGTWLKTDFFKP